MKQNVMPFQNRTATNGFVMTNDPYQTLETPMVDTGEKMQYVSKSESKDHKKPPTFCTSKSGGIFAASSKLSNAGAGYKSESSKSRP